MEKRKLILKNFVILLFFLGISYLLCIYVTNSEFAFILLGGWGFYIFLSSTVDLIKSERQTKEDLARKHKLLSSDKYCKMELKKYDNSIIPVDDFICSAKVIKKNGHIKYKISLNFESETADYEKFFQCFDFKHI